DRNRRGEDAQRRSRLGSEDEDAAASVRGERGDERRKLYRRAADRRHRPRSAHHPFLLHSTGQPTDAEADRPDPRWGLAGRDGESGRGVNDFRFNERPVNLLKNVEALRQAVPTVGGGFGGSMVVPGLRAREFSFTSKSDAV